MAVFLRLKISDIDAHVNPLAVPDSGAIAAPDALTLPMTLPAHLDGRDGSNRYRGPHAQISAQTDIEAVTAWLARYADKKTTFDSYRKEAERLLLWSTLECGKALSSLRHEDLLAYQHFLADPQPAARWVMPPGRKKARGDPAWRPFAGPLSPASRRQASVILGTLFTWLVGAGYLAGNPWALSHQRQARQAPRITRLLDEPLWTAVKQAVDTMPQATARDLEHYRRVRWMFSLLYLCGLRISELAGNTMGGFVMRPDNRGEARWWLEVTGKGDKQRLVPATTELMQELAGYRLQRGLSPAPMQGETTPLVMPVGGPAQPLTRSALHIIVKQVFRLAAERLASGGPEHALAAARLAAASAHWLRHTAGSNMASGDMDLRHVRDNLGHESLSTTSRYLHSEDDARHRDTEEKHRLGW